MLRKLIVIMVGLAVLGGFLSMEAQAHGKELVLRVDTDGFADFDGTIPGAFYVSGAICEDPVLGNACNSIGTFHCWGWQIAAGGAVVSQEFDIDDRGKIQLQGVEDGGPRAVVGGTGDFRNVRGEATGFVFTGSQDEFIATFKLIGAKRN